MFTDNIQDAAAYGLDNILGKLKHVEGEYGRKNVDCQLISSGTHAGKYAISVEGKGYIAN